MVKALRIFGIVLTFFLLGTFSLNAGESANTKEIVAQGDTDTHADRHAAEELPNAHRCISCHKFDESKFKELIRIPDLKVLSSEMTGGLWQVSYEMPAGNRNVVYTSLVMDRVIYGQMVYKDSQSVMQNIPPKYPPKIDTSNMPVRDAAFVMGNKGAKMRIFLFSDLDCPLCAKLHFEVKGFLADHNDYAVYVMLYPSNTHAKAEEKSRVVYCLGENLFLREAIAEKFFSDLIENKKADILLPDPKCDVSGLERLKRYGNDVLGIQETPVIVLPDGKVIRGFVSKKELDDILSGKMAAQRRTN